MPEFLISKPGIILTVLVGLLVLERLFPVARWVGGLWRVARNFSLAAINAALSPLIVLPLTYFAASHGLSWRPVEWSGWGMLLFDIVLLDFWIYWWHRANHALPFLWRFHEVHHLDNMLDVSSALRFHFGEVLLSALVRAAVIVLLDVPFTSVVAFELVVALAAMFHHSNLRLPGWFEQPLSRLIVTPSLHWIHHHALRADTDSNYSTFLSVWDRLFASKSQTLRTPELAMGVEGERDKPGLKLVIRPFDPR